MCEYQGVWYLTGVVVVGSGCGNPKRVDYEDPVTLYTRVDRFQKAFADVMFNN